jgi:hypothetical protein
MQIPAITPVSVSPVAPLTQFVQRLAAQLGTSMAKETDTSERGGSSPTLTPGLLRATLMSMGVAADAQNMALAEAFSRLGLALTREALTEAHVALAQAPEASPRAYALARAWGLPTSAAALNALTTAIGESPLPLPQALPVELMSWLGLAADTSLEPEALAAHLYLMAQGAGRSTENRLAALLTQSGSTHVGVWRKDQQTRKFGAEPPRWPHISKVNSSSIKRRGKARVHRRFIWRFRCCWEKKSRWQRCF